MVKQGFTEEALADNLDYSLAWMKELLSHHGLQAHGNQMESERIEKEKNADLLRRIHAGSTRAELADYFQVKIGTISQWCTKLRNQGIKVPRFPRSTR